MDLLGIIEHAGAAGVGVIGKALWDRFRDRERRADSLHDTMLAAAKQIVEEQVHELRNEVKQLRSELDGERAKTAECERRAAELSARITVLEVQMGSAS